METIVVKKVVPPTNGDEKVRNKIVKEGLDSVISQLKQKGYLTLKEETIDDYTILEFMVSDLTGRCNCGPKENNISQE